MFKHKHDKVCYQISSMAAYCTLTLQKLLYNIETIFCCRNLNPENEMRKKFGSNVVGGERR